MRTISVHGASEHNLKNASVEIPRDALVVFTGVSGSGKSSLVFDTLFREGQRRFLESLSTFARQLLGGLDRPAVDRIEGLSPTLSVDQRTSRGRIRSTVGTITDIQDHFRLLFARAGQAHDPKTGRALKIQNSDQISQELLEGHTGKRGFILAPLIVEDSQTVMESIQERVSEGYQRWRVDGEILKVRLNSEGVIDWPGTVPTSRQSVEIVYDRLALARESLSRLRESVEKSLELGGGEMHFVFEDGESLTFRSREFNDEGEAFPLLEPGLFSFNSPKGACRWCQGVGEGFQPDLGRLTEQGTSPVLRFIDRCDSLYARIPPGEAQRDLLDSATHIVDWAKKIAQSEELKSAVTWSQVPADIQKILLEGESDTEAGGLLYPLEEYLARTTARKCPSAWRASFKEDTCRHCEGARLSEFARAVTFEGKSLVELNQKPISELKKLLEQIRLKGTQAQICEPILKEIQSRLTYLEEVGVGYLSLDRGAPTLSGGEAQRVRLAGQVGSTLQGVLFVLDEPSIGLHPRDNRRLIRTLKRLRDQGNSVLVVEHDLETLYQADHIIDLGPGAGENGGEVLAQGDVSTIAETENSLTGAHLAGRLTIEVPKRRRKPSEKKITIGGARFRNLKDIEVEIPLGLLVAMTGVSGSGKSTLVHGILKPALSSQARSGTYRKLYGADHIKRVVEIDQKPIGRSPRSNPATYTKIFEPIRELFANTTLARRRRYSAGRFSFNSSEGRCFKCQGAGYLKIEMEFLPSVEVTCEECRGQRYDRETLEVKFRGVSIAEVLEMSIEEALEFFRDQNEIAPTLQILCDIGLGYLRLGHPASALSGGEAQRIKLGAELRRTSGEGDLILLDEPTTGLHTEDVRILLQSLQRLVASGASVLVIEHNLELLKVVDHIIDLGPEGGSEGGELVACGTPEEVAQVEASFTGQALKEVFEAEAQAQSLNSESVVKEVSPIESGVQALRDEIRITGANQHNLKSLDLSIPRQQLTVVTGVSGSGKSSLAFNTLFAEGQRRYVESLSTYARRFLGRLRSSDVERIEGLSPAVAIDQRPLSSNPHSTLGTVTEIYHHLRLLYARLGVPRCPDCDLSLFGDEPGALASELVEKHSGEKGYILSSLRSRELKPLNPLDPHTTEAESIRELVLFATRGIGLDGSYDSPLWRELDTLVQEGYSRILIGDKELRLDDDRNEVRNSLRAIGKQYDPDSDIEVWLVIDRVSFSEGARSRIATSLELAYEKGEGQAAIKIVDGEFRDSSSLPCCSSCGYTLKVKPSPRLFSFNSRDGACPSCEGIGEVKQIRPGSLIVNSDQALLTGALASSVAELAFPPTSSIRQQLESWAHRKEVPLDEALDSWSPEHREELLNGESSNDDPDSWPGLEVAVSTWYENHRRQLKPGVFSSIVDKVTCPSCHGSRLREEARRFFVGGFTIDHIVRLNVEEAYATFQSLELTSQEREISHLVIDEILTRFKFLLEMGLRYLTLDRPTATLSGGEAQRIRLASQVAHRMSGVLYVFDEPTVGLHPRDTQRLLNTFEELKERGNTLVVVEHDPETIKAADHILELGPGAGPEGGRLLASGNLDSVCDDQESLTGNYLMGRKLVAEPKAPRSLREGLKLSKVNHHNLKDLSVEIPLGGLVAVSGVSGSGKSSLIFDVLAEAVREELKARNPRGRKAGRGQGESVVSSRFESIEGLEHVQRLALVDQSPIGRSPRSNPATYTGAWEAIRQFYAQIPQSRLKGFTAKRFSTSSQQGRCPACKGEGSILVDMHFLSDVWLECDMCHGERFNEETLAVKFKGLHVGDLLKTEVREAAELFQDHPKVRSALNLMVEVGLGYLKLGQSATTLSGGEAQRVKLAKELAGKNLEGTLFIFDEPTTGLHFEDVRQLLKVFDRLIEGGGSIIVIEHNIDVLQASDHIIDLGPEGGEEGGQILAQGPPEVIRACEESHTGRFLKSVVGTT